MKVMIWGDMEGVACVESWEQVSGGSPLYTECRALFTQEMNAAVRGAVKAGATEVVAIDCHGAGGGWSFKSIVPDLADERAEWVLGHPWARYVEPLQQGCDAVLFVGAHARAGTSDGVLCHTVSSELWYEATINGVAVGESGILAAVCGTWNVPAILVTGDAATCREVTDLLGSKVTVAQVKTGLSRFSCRSLAPSAACTLIEERTYEALTTHDWPAAYRPEPPVVFRVELTSPDQVSAYRGREGVEIVGPRTVEARGDTFWEAWNHFWYRA